MNRGGQREREKACVCCVHSSKKKQGVMEAITHKDSIGEEEEKKKGEGTSVT